MKCNKCKDNLKMACIPYISHELRMEKAYEREKRLKNLLVACNIIWFILLTIALTR